MNNETIQKLQESKTKIQYYIQCYGNLPELERQLKVIEIELDVAWRQYTRP